MPRKKKKLVPDDERHGTRRGYNLGCRSDCCRTVANIYHRNYRKNHIIKPNDPKYNTYSGYAAGCRLRCCRDAFNLYRRTRRKILDQDDDRHGAVSGYNAGCRLKCCTLAFGRHNKFRRENSNYKKIKLGVKCNNQCCIESRLEYQKNKLNKDKN